jgi:alpha-tubulin suppressor-like RCC1 family protein
MLDRARFLTTPATPALGRLWWALAVLGLACGEDFPNAPAGTLTIQLPSGSADTLAVRDSANLTLHIEDSAGDSITGIQVAWQSSDPAIVSLEPVSSGGDLTSQLTIRMIAHARGPAVVTAVVEGEGFERAELTHTVTVTERWLAISAGLSHTCAIAADSSAYCWGAGQKGTLGNGRPLDSSTPVKVLGPADLKFVAISAGEENSCGLTVEHLAYCWGSSQDGRLGNNDASGVSQFLPVPVFGGATYRSLAAGRTTCAPADDGTASCWGDNRKGQLGIDPPLSALLDCSGQCTLRPRTVSSMDGARQFQAVDVGVLHTCGISESSVFCWGSGDVVPITLESIFLLGDDTHFRSDTAIVIQGSEADSITVGGQHACLIEAGAAECWGRNDRGELGTGATIDEPAPRAVGGELAFKSISAGQEHTCGLAASSEAYCWGSDLADQLGVGTTESCSTIDPNGVPIVVPCVKAPTRVAGGLTFAVLSAGFSHTCAVTQGGAAYCWGEGGNGKLGTGSMANQPLPTRVSEPK